MKLDTLKSRIENAEAKIEKKGLTIEKKQAQIEKKGAMLNKKYNIDHNTFDKYNREGYGWSNEEQHDVYWTMCDIDHLKEDIKRGSKEIDELKKNLVKYNEQLEGEIAKEEILLKDIPESMKRMQEELVTEWDRYDLERKERICKARRELEWKEFHKKYSFADRQFADQTNDQIHNANIRAAKSLILNLYYRVKGITGEITSWAGIEATVGTQGFTVLNGYVEGKTGRCSVESILAGGYNIQKLHVRVLTHELI